MVKYKIVTDSTVDLPLDVVNEIDVEIMPMDFTLDGRVYTHYADEREISSADFYVALKNAQKATTSQVQYEVFVNTFEKYLNRGMDVLYISLSSGLSGTCQTSMVIADELMEKHPGRKILVVDSLAASTGEGMLVQFASIKRDEGMDLESLYNWLNETKMKICHWFTVDDLVHLKKGGRISAATALIGSALAVKPIMHVDDEGHLVAVGKVRGRRKSLEELANRFFETAVEPESQNIYISHGSCVEDAEVLAEIIKQKVNVKSIKISNIGPVIGVHSGPGTIAVFFLGTQR